MAELTSAAELATKNPTRHPNESGEYRRDRQALLVEEIELRRHAERVAALRRNLPAGGEVPQDYHFLAEDGSDVTLSDLFGEHDTLVIYSYMFGPQRRRHARCARRSWAAWTTRSPTSASASRSPSPPAHRSNDWLTRSRHEGGAQLPVFSDQAGDYTRDYVFADDADMPTYNVFTRRDGVIRHFWSDEISGDMADPGQIHAVRSRWTHCGFSSTRFPRAAAPTGTPD